MRGNLSKLKGINFDFDKLTPEQKSELLKAALPEVKAEADKAEASAKAAAFSEQEAKNAAEQIVNNTEAAESFAREAEVSKLKAETAAKEAEEYSNQIGETAKNALNAAGDAANAAQSAKADAEAIAGRIAEAEELVKDASTLKTEVAELASAAEKSKTDAEGFKDDTAESARTASVQAQNAGASAREAKEAAQSAYDKAQAAEEAAGEATQAADSVEGAAERVDKLRNSLAYEDVNTAPSDSSLFVFGLFSDSGKAWVAAANSDITGDVVFPYEYVADDVSYPVISVGSSGSVEVINVVLPNGIEIIDENAFAGSSSLKSVTIPKSVVTIGSNAFEGCTTLKDVYYKGSKREWDTIAIGENTELLNATIHFEGGTEEAAERLKYYKDMDIVPSDSSLFEFYTNDETMTATIIDGGLNSSDDATGSLTGDIVIPYEYIIGDKTYRVTAIGEWGFRGAGITSVIIPGSVSVIENTAFGYCGELSNVVICGDSIILHESVFDSCSNLTQISLPENTLFYHNEIYGYAFNTFISTGITNIELPKTLTIIDGMFVACPDLTSITVPDGVNTIGEMTFGDCSSLESVVLPVSLTQIHEMAFLNCVSLKNIYFKGTKEQWEQISGTEYFPSSVTIHYDFVPATEGYVNEKVDALKPIITETGDVTAYEMELLNNNVTSLGVVSESLTVTIGEAQSFDHTSVIYFTTPEAIPENYTTFPEIIHFKGDGTSGGAFTPEANMRYTIIFDYDGKNVVAYVSEVSAV